MEICSLRGGKQKSGRCQQRCEYSKLAYLAYVRCQLEFVCRYRIPFRSAANNNAIIERGLSLASNRLRDTYRAIIWFMHVIKFDTFYGLSRHASFTAVANQPLIRVFVQINRQTCNANKGVVRKTHTPISTVTPRATKQQWFYANSMVTRNQTE